MPVIAFTAFAMQGDEERFLAAGCDGYLTKPIDVHSFAAAVRKHL
jgi:two-component system cell cycle response regulator DivK